MHVGQVTSARTFRRCWRTYAGAYSTSCWRRRRTLPPGVLPVEICRMQDASQCDTVGEPEQHRRCSLVTRPRAAPGSAHNMEAGA